MRFIDTGQSLQPHHGGIVAWQRNAKRVHDARVPEIPNWDNLVTHAHKSIREVTHFAYDTADIVYSGLNRRTIAYNHAAYNYTEAPDDTENWRAYVVPNGVSEQQLARAQWATARLYYIQRLALIGQVRIALGVPYGEHLEQLVQHAASALPLLHTVGIETDGDVPEPLAITGLWVPNVAAN